MIKALWYRIARVWGWEPAEPKLTAKRMPRDWWKHPPAFDKNWRKDVVGRPF